MLPPAVSVLPAKLTSINAACAAENRAAPAAAMAKSRFPASHFLWTALQNPAAVVACALLLMVCLKERFC